MHDLPPSCAPCYLPLTTVKLSNKGKISKTFPHLHCSELPRDQWESHVHAGLCHKCSAGRVWNTEERRYIHTALQMKSFLQISEKWKSRFFWHMLLQLSATNNNNKKMYASVWSVFTETSSAVYNSLIRRCG